MPGGIAWEGDRALIELKNINLDGISISEQIKKIDEEEQEQLFAIVNGDKENIKEEFWDVVQSWLGFLKIRCGITAEELMDYYPKHLEKIRFRPRQK